MGARSTVVGIIAPLVEIGLTFWPKTGGAGAEAPPACDSPVNNDVVCTTYICRCTIYYTLICKVFALSYPLNV